MYLCNLVGVGKIIIPYSLGNSDEYLKGTIAHEYHHSVWAEKYANKVDTFSILDNIVFEGKAVKFQKSVYPDIDMISVDLTYDKELWSQIEPDLNKSNLKRSLEIVHGGKELPYTYGYSEGYKMIKSYLDL